MKTYTSKRGSADFARKLRRLVRRGRVAEAHWLLSRREEVHGHSLWNPSYGILCEGGARCAYTNLPVGV